jgi:hypothetical protein
VTIIALGIMAITLIATSIKKLDNYQIGIDVNPNSVSINED